MRAITSDILPKFAGLVVLFQLSWFCNSTCFTFNLACTEDGSYHIQWLFADHAAVCIHIKIMRKECLIERLIAFIYRFSKSQQLCTRLSLNRVCDFRFYPILPFRISSLIFGQSCRWSNLGHVKVNLLKADSTTTTEYTMMRMSACFTRHSESWRE